MGEAERPLSFRCPFYSARLLLRVASRRKFFISLSKSDRVIRKKLSVQTLRSVEGKHFKDGISASGDKYLNPKNVSPGHENSERTHARRSSGCYLCMMRYNEIKEPEQASSDRTNLCRKPPVQYLPISRSQPPTPPRRSTSLPYFKHLQKYEITTKLSKGLTTFQLPPNDGTFFQYLVCGHTGTNTNRYNFQCSIKDPIWSFILQVSSTEPCIQHLATRYASISMSLSHTPEPPPKTHTAVSQKQLSHPFNIAASHPAFLLLLPNASISPGGWELALLATYMHTVLHLLVKNGPGTTFWLRRGYRILRAAMRRFSRDPDGEGWDLPGSMRDIALAFARLNL